MQTVYLAGGCFWGMQKFIDQFDRVISTETGYANGPSENPSYKEVCDDSGHAETVKVVYDENIISLKQILDYYFMVIDPLSVNRQGGDSGIQYRTGVYYTDESMRPGIEEVFSRVETELGSPLAVELSALQNFYPAEEYHQKYLDKNPGGYCHIPKKFFSLQKKPPFDFRAESEGELRERIGDLAFQVTKRGATEAPFSGEYDGLFEDGIYVDVISGQVLFTSIDKFDSGCGWPAFSRPASDSALMERDDRSFGMVRTEVRSSLSNAHLGHVFDDGPAESGGLRYCINSAALRFIPAADLEKEGYAEYSTLFTEH